MSEMSILRKVLATAGLLVAASVAQATVINFAAMANNPPGERGMSNLHLDLGGGVGVDIKGYNTSTGTSVQKFVYLDSGTGGMGVCNKLITDTNSSLTNNVCSKSNDDNVTTGEYLNFVFDHAVTVDNLWFNNNHDGHFNSSSTVNIAGLDYSVKTGYAGGINGIGSFNVAANTDFKVAYSNIQFYVDGMEVTSQVPEPSTIALFGMGLIALGFARKSKKH
jgi:hypothetical protein